MWEATVTPVAAPAVAAANTKFFGGAPVFSWMGDTLVYNTDLIPRAAPPPGQEQMVQMTQSQYQALMAQQQQQQPQHGTPMAKVIGTAPMYGQENASAPPTNKM